MTYLQYNQINLGEGDSVDLEQDVIRASEERSAAIRSFARAYIRRLQSFRRRVSSRPLFGGLGRSGSPGIPA